MKRKILSCLLAIAMVISAIPVMAEDGSSNYETGGTFSAYMQEWETTGIGEISLSAQTYSGPTSYTSSGAWGAEYIADNNTLTAGLYDAKRNGGELLWTFAKAKNLSGIVLSCETIYQRDMVEISYYNVFVTDTAGTKHVIYDMNYTATGRYAVNITVPESIGEVTSFGIEIYSNEKLTELGGEPVSGYTSNVFNEIHVFGADAEDDSSDENGNENENVTVGADFAAFQSYEAEFLLPDGTAKLNNKFSFSGDNTAVSGGDLTTKAAALYDGNNSTVALLWGSADRSADYVWTASEAQSVSGIAIYTSPNVRGTRDSISYYKVYVEDAEGNKHYLYDMDNRATAAYAVKIEIPETIGAIKTVGVDPYTEDEITAAGNTPDDEASLFCEFAIYGISFEGEFYDYSEEYLAMDGIKNLTSQAVSEGSGEIPDIANIADKNIYTGMVYASGRDVEEYIGLTLQEPFKAKGLVLHMDKALSDLPLDAISYYDVYVKDAEGTVHTLYQQGLSTEDSYTLNISVPDTLDLLSEVGIRIWSYDEAGFASVSEMEATSISVMELGIFGDIPTQFDAYCEEYLEIAGVKNITSLLTVPSNSFWPASSTPNMTDGDLSTGALYDAGRSTADSFKYIGWSGSAPMEVEGIVLHMDKNFSGRGIEAVSYYDLYVKDMSGNYHTVYTKGLSNEDTYTVKADVPDNIGMITEAGIKVWSYEDAGYSSKTEMSDTATSVCEIAFFGSTATPVSEGRNITYHSGGATTEFYSNDYTVEKAFDGKDNTFVYMWASKSYANSCWIKVDLGNAMPIEDVLLKARVNAFESGEVGNLQIRGSNDRNASFEEMTLLGTTPSKDATNAIKAGGQWVLSSVVSEEIGSYRYIAVGNESSSREANIIVLSEIQVFANPDEYLGNLEFVASGGAKANSFDNSWESRLEARLTTVKNLTDREQSYAIVLAGYEDGRLVNVKTQPFTVEAGETATLETSTGFKLPKGTDKAKVMLFRDLQSAYPLVDSVTIDGKDGVGKMLEPMWDTDTNTMYNESLTMIVDADTGIAEAQLFYKPTEVLTVMNSELTVTYEEGVDYVVEGDKIRLTPESNIFSFTEAHLYTDEKASEAWGIYNSNQEVVQDTSKPKIFYRGDEYFHQRQISVTYTYDPNAEGNTASDGRWDAGKPVFVGNNMPRTMQKLRNGEDLTIVLYGDSISYGCDGSGYAEVAPYQPTWGQMLVNKLESTYNSRIKFYNNSQGGASAEQKMTQEQMQENVLKYNPDLVILAWGMNDGVVAPANVFKGFIQTQIDRIHSHNPNAEIVLVATSTPNPEAMNGNYPFMRFMQYYKEALDELTTDGIVVANIRDMQKELMERKRYIDITGNNINHPNDFFIRCHAQYFIDMFVEE